MDLDIHLSNPQAQDLKEAVGTFMNVGLPLKPDSFPSSNKILGLLPRPLRGSL
jgi:hypothetical protein